MSSLPTPLLRLRFIMLKMVEGQGAFLYSFNDINNELPDGKSCALRALFVRPMFIRPNNRCFANHSRY
jgi:hypothetical protein